MNAFTTKRALIALASMSLLACSDEPQGGDDNNGWVIIIEDDAGGGEDTGGGEDAGGGGEDAGEDAGEENTVSDAPQANVFASDPQTDRRATTIVELPRPTEDRGNLTNAYVQVNNCIEENGEPLVFQGFTAGFLCKEVQTALPNADGDYLHITPPERDNTAGDLFAEVQMYYHVNQIHDYYSGSLGLRSMDFSLPAIANLKLFVSELAAQFIGLRAGWNPFDNAAFLFPEAFAQFGLPPRDQGAIVFGQGTAIDFSYDSSVIYHEYTHAVIGSQRLNRPFVDTWGANNTARAINEGLADYFAATKADAPNIGAYGLAGFGDSYTRDLSERRTCPENLETEAHADGKIVGSVLWAMRAEVGAEIVDDLALAAIESSNASTGLDEYMTSLLDEADLTYPDVAAQLRAIAEDFGVDACARVRPWANFQVGQGGVPISVPGGQELGQPGWQDLAPGYFQFSVEVPADKAAVLTWTMQAGGGFPGGGGGGTPELDAILRLEEPVAFRSVGGRGQYDADVELDPIASGTSQSITLGPTCVGSEGVGYLAFLNRGSGLSITQMRIEVVDLDAATDVVDCTPAAE
jgi:hypothetical protein